MAKGSGSTRGSSSSSPRGVSSVASPGTLNVNDFPAKIKLSDFYDEGQFVNGGSFSITSKDGYTMSIDTENGYNEDYREYGTSIQVGITAPSGRYENLTNGFVEGNSFRESGGRELYSTDRDIERYVNGSMPYFSELANRWKKNNK